MKRLLDLYCGAGGAAMGYHEAGFNEIVGIDIVDQPRYPFTFVQGDALEYVRQHGHEFDTIHSSPPCQGYNSLHKVNGRLHGKVYPNLIAATRKALQATGKPYVIENVVDARKHLIDPVMLCGTFFGLKVYRHRLFECNPSLSRFQPRHVPHDDRSPGCNGNRTSPKGYITVCGGKGGGFRIEPASKAMGINWMIRCELAQAIPPAYTRWIGQCLLEVIAEMDSTRHIHELDEIAEMVQQIEPGCENAMPTLEYEFGQISEEKATAKAAAKQTKSTGDYTMSAQVSEEVLAVLRFATVEGNSIKLNTPQLDRKLYVKVNEALERIGGKWKGGKVAAHVFDADPTEALQSILDGQNLPEKNPFAFFATPDDLALRMAKMLLPENVANGVLEPEAGNGALALAVQSLYPDVRIDCVEIESIRAKKLKSLGFNVHECDFLSYEPGRKYRAIIMNPPFSTKEDKQAYVTHIEKAFSLLDDGGQLIAIAPSGLAFNNQGRVQKFRAFVQEHGGWENLESESFKVSGTGVETVLISLQRPRKELPVANPQSNLGTLINLHSTEVEVVATSDLDELKKLESEIRSIQEGAWVETGRRLAQIKFGKTVDGEEGLWKAGGYTSWDTYCRDRWKLAKSTANEMIAGVKVLEEVDVTASSLPLSKNATKPLAKMLNAGKSPEQVQRFVQGLAQANPGQELTKELIEESATEKGLLPKKEPKPIVAQAQSVGLSGKESQQLPDVQPNADIAPKKVRASLADCISMLDVTDFIKVRLTDAIVEFVGMTWQERNNLRRLTQGTVDNQLMANATERQRMQVMGLLSADKDARIEYLESVIVQHEKNAEERWEQLVSVREERDRLAARVAELETGLGQVRRAA